MTTNSDTITFTNGAIVTGMVFSHVGGAAGDGVEVQDENSKTVWKGYAEGASGSLNLFGVCLTVKKLTASVLSNGELLIYHK
jgi:riboflavin synthase alpha subunit